MHQERGFVYLNPDAYNFKKKAVNEGFTFSSSQHTILHEPWILTAMCNFHTEVSNDSDPDTNFMTFQDNISYFKTRNAVDTDVYRLFGRFYVG